ncbi:MAG: AsmA family protein, partial [Burkholderiales bacterium]
MLKTVLVGAGALAALAVVAVIGLFLVVDGKFVKAHVVHAMQEKHRTLTIEGEPRLTLFPVAGIALGKTTLSEPGSHRIFLSFDSAEVAVQVMPLLSGEVAIESLKLANLKANVVRRKDGSMNVSYLAGTPAKDGKKEPMPVLRLAGISIEGVQVAFHDEASGQQVTLAELNLKAGRLDGATPGEVTLSARISGKRPDIDLRAQADGALSFNLRKDEFAFDKFTARLKGRLDQETIAAEFAAPKLAVSAARASGSAMQGSLQLKGPQRSLDVSYTVSMAGPPLTADLLAKLDGSTVKANIELPDLSPLKAKFDLVADKLDLDRYFPPERRDATPNRAIDLSG